MSLDEKVNNGLWEEALSDFQAILERGRLTIQEYILGAAITFHFGDLDSMFGLLSDGIKHYSTNYELFYWLGNYYSRDNADLAYLCYENALYYLDNSYVKNAEDRIVIVESLDELIRNNDVAVNNVSFIILSYNTLEDTRRCIESIRETCALDSYEIIIVDNASKDGSLEWLKAQSDIILIENKENVGFPSGCNQGINCANRSNDIFLLNSDTVMLRNSLFMLRMGLYSREEYGAAGAATNNAANNQILNVPLNSVEEYGFFAGINNIPREKAFELKSKLVMFAMLIKRNVYDVVGPLDERFTPGNYEDDDYGWRIMQAGYKNVLCWNSFIYHYGSKSFGKMPEKTRKLLAQNKQKLIEKWGMDPDIVMHFSGEIVNKVLSTEKDEISVLEVECGLGENLTRILSEKIDAKVKGTTSDKNIQRLAESKINIEYITSWKQGVSQRDLFDFIILDKVIDEEQLDTAIEVYKKNLDDNGVLIIRVKDSKRKMHVITKQQDGLYYMQQ